MLVFFLNLYINGQDSILNKTWNLFVHLCITIYMLYVVYEGSKKIKKPIKLRKLEKKITEKIKPWKKTD
jgi:hypothetical protein